MMVVRTLLLGLVVMVVQGCGSDDDGSADVTVEEVTGAADADAPDERITCENACVRAPRCEDQLVTEADCLTLCSGDEDPFVYACCLQYADGCSAVGMCLSGAKRVCEPEGEPWVPLELFDECVCGSASETPFAAECKETGVDVQCPPEAVCFKPVNESDPPFCAVDCTLDASVCPEGTSCENTPKSRWCKPI